MMASIVNQHLFITVFRSVLMLVLMMPALSFSAEQDVGNRVHVHKNEDTGLLTWTSESEGFSVEFIQLLPDFVRAIYSKHHFPADEVERIANYCVYGSIIKNTSQQVLSYRVADWYYSDAVGDKKPVKTKSQWIEEWRKAGVSFSWTLLPDSGVFEVGDWQQGFTTVMMPRESLFDFTYSWRLDGVLHSATIKNMVCPPADL